MPANNRDRAEVATPRRITVVGASLAGVRVMKALRRKGFDGQLVLVGDEDELPYDRPPLSKTFLTSEDDGTPKLLEPEAFYDDVELHLGSRAIALRTTEGAVELQDGTLVRSDHVVVATGAGARTLPLLPDGERVGRLRTVADARRLRSALQGVDHVLVVGGGFIGCEVAASARRRGIAVTIVEPQAGLVARGVAAPVGRWLAALHRDRGVDLRLGVGIADVTPHPERVAVTLTDGSILNSGYVVVGVGAHPHVGWLRGSGLHTDDGLLCDHRGRAVSGVGRVWGAGDASAWPSARAGSTRRIEHWTNAAEQAAVLAANLLGVDDAPTHDPVPYVWSDQYEHKLQMLGSGGAEDDLTLVHGTFDDGRFALVSSRDGVLTGAVACDAPREIARLRPLIATAAPLSALLESSAGEPVSVPAR